MPEENMQDPEVREDDETVVPPVHPEHDHAPEGAEAPKEEEDEAGDAA